MSEGRRAHAAARVPVDALVATCHGVLSAVGVADGDARATTDVLVESELAGVASHGVMRLSAYVERIERGSVDPRARPSIVQHDGATAVVDGANALGPVAARFAMATAIDTARAHGVGFVVARDVNHFGAAAAYAQQAVVAGMVGIAAANATAVMPAPGGKTPVVGNNPIAFGIPTCDEPPVVLDIATSVVSAGKVLLAHRAGEPVPTTWAIRLEPTETGGDASATFPYLLRPMADHKGFGLALVIDLLAGVLSGARHGPDVPSFFGAPDERYGGGAWFLALDVARFRDLVAFGRDTDAYLRRVREGEAFDASQRPRAPGWGRAERREAALRSGIEVAGVTVRELDALARRLGAPALTSL